MESGGPAIRFVAVEVVVREEFVRGRGARRWPAGASDSTFTEHSRRSHWTSGRGRVGTPEGGALRSRCIYIVNIELLTFAYSKAA